MGFINNFMKKLRITDDVDSEYYDEEDDYEPSPASRGGLFSRRSNDDFEEEDAEYDAPKPSIFGSRNKSSNITPVKRSMEVSMIRPQSVDDARVICDLLLDGNIVILNMEGLHTEIAQRIIDYTSGATYSIKGKLQKISTYIFMAAPATVAMSGDFQDLNQLVSGGFDDQDFNVRI